MPLETKVVHFLLDAGWLPTSLSSLEATQGKQMKINTSFIVASAVTVVASCKSPRTNTVIDRTAFYWCFTVSGHCTGSRVCASGPLLQPDHTGQQKNSMLLFHNLEPCALSLYLLLPNFPPPPPPPLPPPLSLNLVLAPNCLRARSLSTPRPHTNTHTLNTPTRSLSRRYK